MNILYPVLLTMILLTGCSSSDLEPLSDTAPSIRESSTYEVIKETDLIYGEGLSHESLNSVASTVVPLRLDVYAPIDNNENRPAFVFIHGGGFTGGTKQQANILNLAEFYASRGWVFISIDYRVQSDLGTVPQEWLDYSPPLATPSQVNQYLAIYPAQRDAKAAMRWLSVHAEDYHINRDYITIGGGSAGAITAITVGISDEEDFRDELTTITDPTLASTYVNESFEVHTIIDFWGSKVALDAHQEIYGFDRFDAGDPPLLIVHGTEDPTVPFSGAEELKSIYETLEIPLAYYPIEGGGHGVWNATVDGKRIEELAFDFIVEQQGLSLE